MSTARCRCGFTLIELMMTMCVSILLLAIGAPVLRDFIIETRMSVTVNRFIAAATLARTEAIKRGRAVVLCRSVNVTFGTGLCDSSAVGGRPGNDWASGWVVIVPDENRVLLRQAIASADLTILAATKAIKYDGLGRPGGSFTKLVFRHAGKFERVICFSRSGRMNVLLGTSECA